MHAYILVSIYHVIQQSTRFLVVYSFTRVAIQKSVDMSVQRLSAGKIALLVCNNCDGNESVGEDEAIGDFTASDGCSYVLLGHSLVQSSRTTLSLPLPAKRDSLLLCETSDLEDELKKTQVRMNILLI